MLHGEAVGQLAERRVLGHQAGQRGGDIRRQRAVQRGGQQRLGLCTIAPRGECRRIKPAVFLAGGMAQAGIQPCKARAIGVHAHGHQHALTDRRRQAAPIEALARLVHHGRVIEARQLLDQRTAQLQGFGVVVRTRLPAQARQLGREQRAPALAQPRLRRRAGQRVVEEVEPRAGHREQRGPAFGGRLWQPCEQIEVDRHRQLAGLRQREAVAEQPHAVGRRELGEAGGEALPLRRVVVDAVEAAATGIGHQRLVAAAVELELRGLAIEQRGHDLRAARQPHGDLPLLRRQRAVQREAALRQRDLRAPVAAALSHLNEREAGLVGPARRHRGHILARGLRHVVPQVAGGGVGELPLAHVGGQPALEDFRAQPLLQHAQDRATLGVGDVVELIGDLGLVDRAGADRARRRGGVAQHRAVDVAALVQRHLPRRIEVVAGLVLHPRGEGLVEPDLVPRRCGDEVAEPLVRDFVRRGGEDAALRMRTAGLRIEQQRRLGVGDQAPVFHRTVAHAGHGELVELRQGVGHAEVGVVVGQDLARDLQRVARLLALARRGEDAQRHAGGFAGQHIEAADRQRDQIARHRGRRREAVQRRVAVGTLLHLRHVRRHFQRARRAHADLEHRAEGRLVEGGEQGAGVDLFQLRGQHARGLAARLVVDAVQALAAGVHDAGVGDAQRVVAGRNRLAIHGHEAPQRRGLVALDAQRAWALRADERRAIGLQLVRMHGE